MRTPEEALVWAKAQTTYPVGMCLKFVRSAYQISSKYNDASEGWRRAFLRHPGDWNPPSGSPVWWTGGSHDFGHVAISDGAGFVISSDVPRAGKVGRVAIRSLTNAWNLAYQGWTEDLNGVVAYHPKPMEPIPQPEEEDDMTLVIREGNRVDVYTILESAQTIAGKSLPKGTLLHNASDDGGAKFIHAQPEVLPGLWKGHGGAYKAGDRYFYFGDGLNSRAYRTFYDVSDGPPWKTPTLVT